MHSLSTMSVIMLHSNPKPPWFIANKISFCSMSLGISQCSLGFTTAPCDSRAGTRPWKQWLAGARLSHNSQVYTRPLFVSPLKETKGPASGQWDRYPLGLHGSKRRGDGRVINNTICLSTITHISIHWSQQGLKLFFVRSAYITSWGQLFPCLSLTKKV